MFVLRQAQDIRLGLTQMVEDHERGLVFCTAESNGRTGGI